MRILELEKIKLGDKYQIIRIKYKTLFGSEKRDVIKDSDIGWKWADANDYCLHDTLLDMFNESSEQKYTLNVDKK